MTPTTPWTPGPWEIRGHTIFEPGKEAMSIATVTRYESNVLANGRLIAAAPDLAATIEAMLSGKGSARNEARALLARIGGNAS